MVIKPKSFITALKKIAAVTRSLFTSMYEIYPRLTASVYRQMIPRSSYIDPTVQIIGRRQTKIGRNSVISQGCWFNVNHRESIYKTIQIGDNCFIGRNNFISVGKSVIIRDYCLTTMDCKFVGSTHIYQDPFLPYITTGTTSNDEIYVGVNCFFGVNVLVIGNVSIGHGSIIGSGAVIRESVPPFSLVVGNPAKVVKRFNFIKKEWVDWAEEDGFDGPGEEEYLEILKKNVPHIRMPLVAASKRKGDL